MVIADIVEKNNCGIFFITPYFPSPDDPSKSRQTGDILLWAGAKSIDEIADSPSNISKLILSNRLLNCDRDSTKSEELENIIEIGKQIVAKQNKI